MSDTPRTDAEMVKSCHENDGAFLAEDMMFFARELERDNARLREAGDYLAKCVRLANSQPDSMADLMVQKWESAKSDCRA